jgi:hypothetical protein
MSDLSEGQAEIDRIMKNDPLDENISLKDSS